MVDWKQDEAVAGRSDGVLSYYDRLCEEIIDKKEGNDESYNT